MPHLLNVPAKHRWVSLKPFVGEVNVGPYLEQGKIEWVLAGGENYLGRRPLHHDVLLSDSEKWVKAVYDDCRRYNVKFTFGQTGNVFVEAGVARKITSRTNQAIEALRTGLNWPPVDIEKEVQAICEERDAKKEAFDKKTSLLVGIFKKNLVFYLKDSLKKASILS